MPTLLSVNNYYYYRGGAETMFFEQNKMFEALGWCVVPFAMRHPKNLESEWANYFVDEIEFGEQYSLLQKLVRTPKVIYSFEAQQKLLRLIDKVRPDVCHAHNIYHHISPSILHTLKRRGVPTVLTLHDLKIACPAYNMLSHDGICERCRGGKVQNVLTHRCIKGSASLSAVVMIEAWVHRLLDSYRRGVSRFAVPSRFYIDKLTEWGFPAGLFAHVPNFVDAVHYRPQYEPGSGFVYFGRLAREKGLVTLIKAAAQARCRITVAGTGPQLEELRQLSARLNADVDFPGFMKDEALHDLVRSARAIVLPSEWYENAPMSILEAYALGKPVIGARIGGIPELVRESETGVTVASGDQNALAAALRWFEDSAAPVVTAMGRAGRHWVETEFAVHHYRDRILAIYRDLGISGSASQTSAAN